MHSVILRFTDGSHVHLEVGDFYDGWEIADIELVEEPLLADPGKNKRSLNKERSWIGAYSAREIIEMDLEELQRVATKLGCKDVDNLNYLHLRNFIVSKVKPQKTTFRTAAPGPGGSFEMNTRVIDGPRQIIEGPIRGRNGPMKN